MPHPYQLPAPLYVELSDYRTARFQLWIKRPRLGHLNWWLCFITTSPFETRAWNKVIRQLCRERIGVSPLQRSTDLRSNPARCTCGNRDHSDCPDVLHSWEMYGGGHGEFALGLSEEPLESLAEVDEPLQDLLRLVPVIRAEARSMLARSY